MDDILSGKQINDYISELSEEKDFGDVKFNKFIEKTTYIFKFYGRGFMLDSICDKVSKFQKSL